MNIISEWIGWKLFRSKGAFRGYWNMTEKELADRESKNIFSALDEVVKMFVERRWVVDSGFLKILMKELKKRSEEHLKVELKLKKEV